MGLTWAAGWAVAGLAIGATSLLFPGLPWSAFFEVFDAPLPALAIPGFFAGVFFSAVLGIAARRRRFSELSLGRFAAWGAVGGVLLLLFPFALVAVGLASRDGSDIGTWRILGVLTGPFVLLSALSAYVTLAIARSAERRVSREPGEDLSDDGPAEGRTHDRLGAAPWPARNFSAEPGGSRRPASPDLDGDR